MARRRRQSSSAPRGKSEREARVERLTWGALVLVFALLQFVPEASVPNWLIPLSGGLILLGSGMYQYSRGWRVSPVTWIGGVLLGVFAFYNLRMNPTANFLGASLLVFAAVILFGVLSGET